MYKAESNDIIISNINAVNKAIAIMPTDLVDCLISPAFTILRIKPHLQNKIDPMYIWSVLRSPAVTAEWLSHTTGFGRHYVDWELIKKLFYNNKGTELNYKTKPTRKGCGCTESTDIGAYNTCAHGCIYCYANIDKEIAHNKYKQHDINSIFLGYSERES